MDAMEVLEAVMDKGILFVIAAFVLFFSYKYAIMKFDLLEKELEKKIRRKGYSIRGNITLFQEPGGAKGFIDLVVEESLESDSEN